MTSSQEKAVDRIREEAANFSEFERFEVSDFSEMGPWYRNVAVWVDFGKHSPRKRQAAHIFIGPRGGISYPVQTIRDGGVRQVCHKFEWNFGEVLDDQEAGWNKYFEFMGW